MDQSNKSVRIAAGVAIVLFLGAIAWGGWNAKENSDLRTEVGKERLRNEELLSQKLQVEKSLASTAAQMSSLSDQNETLARQIQEAKNVNAVKDGSIQALQRQLASGKRSYNDLSAKNREMENQLTSLNQQIGQLQDERLASAREMENLRSQVDNMKRELAMAHNAYYDKVLVESTRGKNDKLVAKASRTRKLKATVMIPSGLKDVQFQVFDPSGKLISGEPMNGTLAVRVNDSDNAIASSSNDGSVQTYKQAEMTYLPKKKLVAGTYRIEVLSENLSVGSLQVRLR